MIDLEANPLRVIDRVVVGDAPEGLAISPTGGIAVAVLLRGSSAEKTSWFYHRNGSVVVLKIEGRSVTRVGEVEVGGLPEGVVFSPDGKYLYVGRRRCEGGRDRRYGNRSATAIRVVGSASGTTAAGGASVSADP